MSRSKIVDEFSDRTDLSRQQKWQLRQRAKGKCILCGRKRCRETSFCADHLRFKARYQRLQNKLKKKAA